MLGARQIQSRRLVLVGVWLFLLSSIFPVVASILPAGPVLVGRIDVVLAFAVTALALFVFAISYRQVDDAARLASFHVYRILSNVPIVLVAAFFLFGNRIDWTILLTGLAWRFWLVCYVLRQSERSESNSHSFFYYCVRGEHIYR